MNGYRIGKLVDKALKDVSDMINAYNDVSGYYDEDNLGSVLETLNELKRVVSGEPDKDVKSWEQKKLEGQLRFAKAMCNGGIKIPKRYRTKNEGVTT